jgi:general stress protein 26
MYLSNKKDPAQTVSKIMIVLSDILKRSERKRVLQMIKIREKRRIGLMEEYKKCLDVMSELFAKDFTFNLATAKENCPSVRVVDTFYDNEVFWIVTYAKSNKVKELEVNPNVALCNNLYSFTGKAYNAGHPLDKANKEIRDKLIIVFKNWYFLHNNEDDKNMCYVKFVPESGFFYKDSTGFKVDFLNKEVEKFPFESHIEGI